MSYEIKKQLQKAKNESLISLTCSNKTIFLITFIQSTCLLLIKSPKKTKTGRKLFDKVCYLFFLSTILCKVQTSIIIFLQTVTVMFCTWETVTFILK